MFRPGFRPEGSDWVLQRLFTTLTIIIIRDSSSPDDEVWNLTGLRIAPVPLSCGLLWTLISVGVREENLLGGTSWI